MPTPWPPAAQYGAQHPYGTHQYPAQLGGQPSQPGAQAVTHRHGMSTGLVAGVTAGALAFGLVAGGGGVALFEYLRGDHGSQSSTENAAFDQGPSSQGGSGSDGSDGSGSGSDGWGSGGSGSDGSGGTDQSPFSGGDGSGTSPYGGWGGAGGGLGGGTGTQQSTTAPTSAQATGVVLIDSVLGYQGAQSAGTGMVLTSDGLVLTNNHVVQGATSVTVTIGATGKTYKAEVVGTDKSKDVALLQLQDASGLATVTLDDDEGVTSGDTVTAVGNAQGGGELVAAPGSVTATDQSMTASTESSDGSETLSGLIEFSAGVVSGDSGGPLLDSEGEVVGMTTAASSGGTNTVAYAIEITDALAVAHKIDEGQAGDGIVIGTPAFLGVAFSSGSAGGTISGATVQQVLQGTPAAKAGIVAGDTITKVDSKAVSSADALSTTLGTYSPGDKVKITWVSGTTGKTQSATVTLMAGPAA
jgi:S1-C subfamily serine protease